MPARVRHDLERAADELLGHVLMEQVTHRVQKDTARFAPSERERELIGVECQVEAVAIARVAHRLEPRRETFRVAVFAARADLRAAGDRIPGRVSPLDRALVSHSGSA